MTKKNIAKISLIILGIAISIGIGIGIAKAQPALPKSLSLQQHTLSLKGLNASRGLKSLKELKTLSGSLLQKHLLESLNNENLLEAHVSHLSPRLDLDQELKNVAALHELHGKLGLLNLTV